VSEVPLYDGFSEDYDRFVDWPGRLAHELPFLEQQLERHGARRILDAACGTGQHALALTRRGYQVDGADLSPRMVERARGNAAASSVPAGFAVGGLGELAQVFPGPYDALICLGNSLPHLLEPREVRAALADFFRVLRPEGLLIIQNRNYDRVWQRRERFMPLETHRQGDREWLFFRFMDYHEATLTFNMVTMERTGEAWTYRIGVTELRPIFQRELAAWLPEAGFGQVRFYGGYCGDPFDPQASSDLIVVAKS
jgi:glycine/sarcosine N-methyltransferase